MKLLNLGSGSRFHKNWINLDFQNIPPNVKKYNLLNPLPFKSDSIDVIYSSHLIEHFSLDESNLFLKECYRVLKPMGIIRIVTPDLENVCKEYINILKNIDIKENKEKYNWIIIELLDQLTRLDTGGQMSKFWMQVKNDNNKQLIDYLQQRTGKNLLLEKFNYNKSLYSKIKSLTLQKIKNKIKSYYINIIVRLLPKPFVNDRVGTFVIGEKHKWMYDKYSLSNKLNILGFINIELLSSTKSNIKNFNSYFLDTNSDGTNHKESSLYIEANK